MKTCYGPSLESSWQDSSNDGSQLNVLKEQYGKSTLNYSIYLVPLLIWSTEIYFVISGNSSEKHSDSHNVCYGEMREIFFKESLNLGI